MNTLSEQVLHACAGEFIDRKVDRAYVHDGTGVLTLEAFRKMSVHIENPDRNYVIFDHITPANNSTTAMLQAELREFALERGFFFSDSGGGICHQVMGEDVVLPGEIVVGADSHTCTLGAFGAFATGVGATDMAAVWASGETWFRVPETIEVNLSGRLRDSAEAKDAALTYVGRLGMDGATYRALEFTGGGAATLTVDERMTLSNLAVETGAKTGLFYADQVTCEYLAGHGRNGQRQEQQDCTYESTLEIDLGDIVPVVAEPPRVDRVRPVSDLEGLPLDQVFVGTCTNGRYEDLARFASIVKGRKVSVRTIIAPASREVLKSAIKTGVAADLIDADCTLLPPGCGPCLGAHMGVIGEGEICLSTANRNFKNRMGVGGQIYLASVSTAAESALRGVLTEPREVR